MNRLTGDFALAAAIVITAICLAVTAVASPMSFAAALVTAAFTSLIYIMLLDHFRGRK